MNLLNTLLRRHALRLLAATAAIAASGTAMAEADSAEAFPTFEKWIRVTMAPAPAAVPARIEAVQPADKGSAVAARYEPLPVILGTPDLPLLGAGARQAASAWGHGLNFQGVRVSLLLSDGKGAKPVVAPLSTRLKPGQRFKLRLTSTFDGVAALDQVLGSAWDAERTGQVYPAAGMSVEVKSGKTVDLPIGEAQYFVLRGRPASERLLLSVRHAKAVGDARSTQAAYRSDGAQGSSYLQLVPAGAYPVVEQLLLTSR